MKKQLIFYSTDYPTNADSSNVFPVCTSQLANTFGMSTSDVLNFFKNLSKLYKNTKTFSLFEEYDIYIIGSYGSSSIVDQIVWTAPPSTSYIGEVGSSIRGSYRIEFRINNEGYFMFVFDSNFSAAGYKSETP